MEHKVLVVEDSRPFRRLLEAEIRKAGYIPYIASSIAQAETILNQDTDFLCAILDYCLPDGQDGEIIDVCLSLDIKVIVLTAMMDARTRERVLAKTVIDYIPKDSPSCVSSVAPLLSRLEKNNQHHVLVVDDSLTARRYVRSLLERQYLNVLEAQNGQEALAMIRRDNRISLVITDYTMPEMDGVSVVKALRKLKTDGQLAIIGLSGEEDASLTARFLKAGANDFLTKPFNQEEFYCRLHSTLNALDTERRLFNMANIDYLTQVWNRRYFFEHPHTRSQKGPRNLALIDVDHFKKINDQFGHHIGDIALIELAKMMKRYFPEGIVARFGGEEFCVLYGNDEQGFERRLEAMREELANTTWEPYDKAFSITISIGMVHADASIDTLIQRADRSLYQAKKDGRNQCVKANQIDFATL
ncbi:diguanylate cyclase response regulator [Salinivibrio sp. MA440]|uniref:response regulator n=1 Tax=Salinivibrio sp. MA440 TaxID=1909456 RepID=UPI000988990B|nr:response regulator [Salinivibrio sp. MA440]OOF07124.1 diguanylate cyclase response regulator [Salinivibrio sp. MA440]